MFTMPVSGRLAFKNVLLKRLECGDIPTKSFVLNDRLENFRALKNQRLDEDYRSHSLSFSISLRLIFIFYWYLCGTMKIGSAHIIA